ncbi:MAG: response regulator [Hyphomicrobiales bacterium]|nr:response regulator [Hyphomicrobiales bacterium]
MKTVRLSLRGKILILVVSAIAIAQALMSVNIAWREAERYLGLRRDALQATAQVLASAASPAAAAGDRMGALNALRAVGRLPGVKYARLARSSGQTLAEIGATEQLDNDVVLSGADQGVGLFELLRARTMQLEAPVIEAGANVGKVVVIGDVSDFRTGLVDALKSALLGGFAALMIALLVAMRLVAHVTRPILELANAMRRVRAGEGYSITLQQTTHDEVGSLVKGFNAMIGDIRQRDDRLARHVADLESEVAARTADYVEARDAAEAANLAKSDFLATMSHEIRTPMNGVMVMAELLAAGDLPPQARRQAEIIARSGQNLLAIINDILDFSKIEAGKLDVERQPVSPAQIAEDTLRLFAERAQSKDLELAGSLVARDGLFVAADPVRLAQVLSNLVNNALKFTDKGSVFLQMGPDSADPKQFMFAVEDTGIGIPADKIDSVFGAFQQADQSTMRKFGGTGLGLSIARRLVEAMGGQLRVTSQPGKGSRFFFSLPLHETSAPAQPARYAGAPKAALLLPESRTRKEIATLLEGLGFSLQAAPDSATRLVIGEPAGLASNDLRASLAPQATVVALARFGDAAQSLLREGRADAALALPLAAGALDAIAQAAASGRRYVETARAITQTRAQYATARVLVVDDAAVNREIAEAALKQFGIAAQLACDGAEAVRRASAEHFDLILMDGSMPLMDGYEAARLIRAQAQAGRRARTPIVALTAHVIGASADAWSQAGMDGVLHKPFTLDQLGAVLAAHLATLETNASAPPVEEPAIDPAMIDDLRRMAGGEALVRRVVALYAAQAPQTVAEIDRAAAAGDTEALRRAAHALKSMSLNIGATTVARSALAIEQAAAAGSIEKTPLAAQLQTALEKLAAA